MRRIVLLTCLLAIGHIYGQNTLIGQIFKAKVAIPAKKIDLKRIYEVKNTGEIKEYDQIIESGVLFEVVDQKADKIVAYILPFGKKESNRRPEIQKIINQYDGVEYVLILASDINTKVIPAKDRVTVGLVTVPFKARFKNKDAPFTFSPDFNLSGALGLRLNPGNHGTFNTYIQFGVGISTVALDTENSAIEDPQNVASISGLLGLMADIKGLQIGIYTGIDGIKNNRVYQWNHNGNLWFSFGVGFGLFQFGGNKN